MESKDKKIIGFGVCVFWGLLCAVLFLLQPFELVTEDGTYTLWGLPVMISSFFCLVISRTLEASITDDYNFTLMPVKDISVVIFMSVQVILYAFIGLVVPWGRFKFRNIK